MKKLILVFVLCAFVACKSVKQNSNEVIITFENEVVLNDYKIVINKIISDSRCPEGTNCIWAGELVMELSVWKKNEMKEIVVLTFSPKTKGENLEWFEKYILQNKKIINYMISPSKTDKQLELKDYKIELILD